MRRLFIGISLLLCFTAASAKSYDAAISTLDLRIKRLENTLSSDGLLDLFQQVEELQNKVNTLQGDLETQSHTLNKLKSTHAQQISDLNSRIEALENIISALQNPDANSVSITDSSEDSLESSLQANDDSDPAESSQTISEPTTAVDTEAIKLEYQTAFDLLRESRYEEATPAFKNFISSYPKSSYADNAQYWLAESFYVQRDFENAILAYQSLIDNYPDSNKASHSALKLAYSYQELGQTDNAVQTLNSIINNYPGTSIADKATERLRSLNNASAE